MNTNKLMELAEKGNSEAMYLLGTRMAGGDGKFSLNEEKAIRLIVGAAEANYDPALNQISVHSQSNNRIAIRCRDILKRNSQNTKNNPRNNKSRGVSNNNGIQTPIYKKESDQKISGYMSALNLIMEGKVNDGIIKMGEAAEHGEKGPLDWLTRKANKGDMACILQLVKLSVKGVEVSLSLRDLNINLYEKATGDPELSYYIGSFCFKDDPERSIGMICDAANGGYSEAKKWIKNNVDEKCLVSIIRFYNEYYKDATVCDKIIEGVKAGNNEMRDILIVDAKNGREYAIKALGLMYETGSVFNRSVDDAIFFYSKSSDPEAKYRMALLLEEQSGINNEVIDLLEYSALKGVREAKIKLSDVARQGNTRAMYCLGLVYKKEDQYTDAYRLIKKASEQGLKEARIWMENENKGGRESSEHGPYGSVSW